MYEFLQFVVFTCWLHKDSMIMMITVTTHKHVVYIIFSNL